jgi:hypothetical protein
MTEEMFKRLKKQAMSDLRFNEENALEMAMKIPNLYQRYLDVYIDEMRKLKELNVSVDEKYGELYKYFKYEDNKAWSNKGDIDSQINSNKEYCSLKRESIKLEFVVKYLEEVLDNIKRMSFSVKNYIDLQKFKAGMY